MIGETHGHYHITERLGAGGMGEVYRATDTKLKRDVAIKVLPDEVAQDPARLARFQREAELLASLNHPHIAAIHGLEEADGKPLLVLELVEGENLEELLRRGKLPPDEALEIAKQIAGALEEAHARGIVHRDLKPANVMLTPDGKAKVLDFGLAKAWAGDAAAGSSSDLSQSPTLAHSATQEGVILGTAAYMSPEQARGKPVDKRADIWAFGAVLFEMLTGGPLFAGETITDLLAAVVKEEPDWRRLPAETPASVRRLLERCLAKDARRRLRDAGDAALELGEPATSEPGGVVPRPRPGAGFRGVLAGGLVLLAVGLLMGWLSRGRASSTAPIRRLSIELPEATPVALASRLPLGVGWPSMVLSPEGERLVFVTVGKDDVRRLAVRDLDDYSIRTLPGTEDAFDPFFSPDGNWLAFFTGDRLRKVSLEGGEPVTVCEARTPRGGTWWGGSIVFSADEGAHLARVSADGGEPQTLVTSATLGSAGVLWPSFLPGGENLLATLERMDSFNPDQSLIVALSADGGRRRDLLSGGSYARFAPPGHLVYSRAGALLAVPFDPVELNVQGDPRTVMKGVRTEARGVPQATIAQDGTLAYLPGSFMGLGELVWAERDGRVESLGLERERFGAFDLSRDGRRLAIVISDERDQLWLYELDRGTRVKLTVEGSNTFPVLSPDGQRMAFLSSRAGSRDVFLMPLDGTAEPRRVTDGPGVEWPYSWTPDGRSLAIGTYDASGLGSLAFVGDDGSEIRSLAGSGANEWGPAVSPDGTYVAFSSDASGTWEVHVRELAGQGRTWKVSAEGGEEPQWSTDGSALFYRNGNVWMEVPVSTKPPLDPGRPREALRGPYANVPGLSYRVSADGQRFLVIRTAETDGLARTVNVVSHWTRELP